MTLFFDKNANHQEFSKSAALTNLAKIVMVFKASLIRQVPIFLVISGGKSPSFSQRNTVPQMCSKNKD